MVVRGRFEYDLKELQHKIQELGELTKVALEKSIRALSDRDVDLALEVIDEDSAIDYLDESINDFAILLLAKQQPVAIDLRRIVVSLRLTTDIERIADFAVNIAKATIRMGERESLIPIEKIVRMHEVVSKMLQLAIQAYVEESVELAKQVVEMDDEVDEYYGENIREVLRKTDEKAENLEQVLQLSFVFRYLERAADHATNVAESIFYLVKGKHYTLNE